MKVPTAAILVIGDEILSGRTEEQNAQFLIAELRELGVALRCILTIPDEIEQVASAARDLAARFDYVFTSGGIGPTHDDVTIKGIASAFARPVIRHPELEQRIRACLGEKIEETHLRMADVPEGTELIESLETRWPVLACANVYILPGVPELFRRKFQAVRERFRAQPFFSRIIYTLADEFDIARQLQTVADEHQQVMIGSYPNFSAPEYRVKVTLESKDETALEAAVAALLTLLDPAQIVRRES